MVAVPILAGVVGALVGGSISGLIAWVSLRFRRFDDDRARRLDAMESSVVDLQTGLVDLSHALGQLAGAVRQRVGSPGRLRIDGELKRLDYVLDVCENMARRDRQQVGSEIADATITFVADCRTGPLAVASRLRECVQDRTETVIGGLEAACDHLRGEAWDLVMDLNARRSAALQRPRLTQQLMLSSSDKS